MTPDEWVRLKRLVNDALARPEGDRSAYLDGHCPDWAFRLEAESLLKAVADSAGSFESPALLIAGKPPSLDAFELLPALPGEFPFQRSAVNQPDDFGGTARYAIRRRIGAGGMGVVYEVEDRSRGQIVALKTLQQWNASDIYRLKREFRALADIAHPNLVSLHDLVVDEGQCFFTMELVEGQTFVEYVRARGRADADRARRCLTQLIAGIEELHRSGQLHRDIKPSNVLVTIEERVVILDFGLTSGSAVEESASPERVVGTPAYMSPERCLGAALSTASDWYSVGATLYHALTGRPPFEGSVPEMLDRKTRQDPPSAASVEPGIPADLSEICTALLHRTPDHRLSGRAALQRLVVTAEQPDHAGASLPETAFVGRARELGALRAAFASVRAGRSAAVSIHGPSGIGKSALLQHFLGSCLADEPALVLRSRCHEHESVPYKGLDGVIDSLSRHLAGLPPADAAALMPRDARALARLFPVMHIEAAATAPAFDEVPRDAVVLRGRAFGALRELLRRIASRQPVVVAIDDFQWADADSTASLFELLRTPAPPPLLLIVAFRSEEVDAKPFLRALLDQVRLDWHAVLPLSPLDGDEASRLIDRLVPADRDHDVHGEIARETGGNPYLIEELARSLPSPALPRRGVTLDEMLTERIAALPAPARVFLDTLAVCGRPILAARVFEACGLPGDERPLVARLRAAHLVRTSRTPDHVEMYHDRIRETLAAGLSDEAVCRIHETMAAILEAHGDDDSEALFEHCRGAGRRTRAAEYAAAAGARASEVLAFDRAATFYREALNLDPDSRHRVTWQLGLAHSLEYGGRPADAADAYLIAGEQTAGMQRLEWQRKAAEQLLMGGHIDRGLAIIDTMLPAVGLRLAPGPRSAVVSMLWRRARLAARGLDFDERAEPRVPRDDLLRIDTCWAISTGLMLVDTVRAAAFHAGHVRMALDAGEPYRIARALALEASFAAAGGGAAGIRRSHVFATRASAAAERLHHPHLSALSSVTAGIAAFVVGDWVTATDLCEQALTTLRERCTGVVWELTLAQNFFLGALMYRGQIRRVAQTLPPLLETARQRGNLYFETEISTRMGLAWLARDDPDASERFATEAISRWSASGFHRQHYNYLIARLQFALYRGQPEVAWSLLCENLPVVRRNFWLHVHFMRVEVAFIRARCALAMAACGHDVRRMHATAAREATVLERENTQWSIPLSLLLRAGLAYAAHDREAAAARLHEAVAAFDRADMRLYAAVARRRLALVGGADQRTQLLREAADYLNAEDIRNPVAMTRLLAPGFPDEAG